MFDINIIQTGVWQSLTGSDTRLPHALLFAGPKGVGKRETADSLAKRLLCERPRDAHQTACGHCDSCIMLASGSHPDFRLLQPEAAEEEGESSGEGEKKKGSKQIRIGQIRELEAFFNMGSHRGGARVCVIEPAEAMNAVTANSLLKILEEPSITFYFIMISHRWRYLLPTLLSRSRRIMFSPPAEAEAKAWLSARKLAGATEWLPYFANAPLALADAAESGRLRKLEAIVADLLKPQDPLAHAARWEGHVKAEGGLPMEELVLILQKWLHDLSRAAAGQTPRYFPHQDKALSAIAQRAAPATLLQAERQVMQLRAWSNHPLNPRLFLEDLCVRAFRPLSS